MATIRHHRLVYQFNVDRAPIGVLEQIKFAMLDIAPNIPKKIQQQLNSTESFKELIRDKIIFNQKNIDSDKVCFEICWYPRGYVLQDVKNTNKTGELTGSLRKGIPLFGFAQPFKMMKKVGWLTVKEEELRAEMAELDSIQSKFKKEGISSENPATIIMRSSQSGKEVIFKNVSYIEKSSNKSGVADFVFLDAKGQEILNSGMSHKCVGFERYAAFKTILKNLNNDSFLKNRILEIENKINKRWIKDSILNQESSGYWEKVDSENISELLYGHDAKILAVSAQRGLDLRKIEENVFELYATGEKKGGSELLLYPEIPKAESYKPIIVVRYGSGGSRLYLKKEDVSQLGYRIENGIKVSDRIKLESKESKINSAYIPLRYYISPMRRKAGKNIND